MIYHFAIMNNTTIAQNEAEFASMHFLIGRKQAEPPLKWLMWNIKFILISQGYKLIKNNGCLVALNKAIGCIT